MKFFAFALLIAAVAAEDAASRSARSLIGLGHGVAGVGVVGVAAPAVLTHAHAPVAVAAAPIGIAPWGVHGVHGIHGIHRRSLVAPGLVGLGHAGIVSPVVGVGHAGLVSPGLVGLGHPGLVSPVVGHGVPLIRHGRSIVGHPAVLGAHGIAVGPVAHVAAVPAIGHGVLAGPAIVGHGIHGLHGPIAIHG